MARLNVMIETEWDRWFPVAPETAGKDAVQTFEALGVALAAGDAAAARKQWVTLGERLRRRTDAAGAQDRLLRLIECKRKLVDTCVKNVNVMSQVCTQEELGTILHALGAAVRRTVLDSTVRGQIFADFEATLQRLEAPWEPPGAEWSTAESSRRDVGQSVSTTGVALRRNVQPTGDANANVTKQQMENQHDINNED